MSRDTVVTDGEGNRYSFDNLSTQKWLEGHYRGLDDCADWLNSEATLLFGKRKTQEAVELQALADRMRASLRPEMVKRADVHAQEFPSKLERLASGKRATQPGIKGRR